MSKALKLATLAVVATGIISFAILRNDVARDGRDSNQVKVVSGAAQSGGNASIALPPSTVAALANPTSSPARTVKTNMVSELISRSRGVVVDSPEAEQEPRDGEWADSSETQISKMLNALPSVDAGKTTVVCGSTVCQVNGRLKNGLSVSNQEIASSAIADERYYNPSDDLNFMPKRSVANTDGDGAFSISLARLHR